MDLGKRVDLAPQAGTDGLVVGEVVPQHLDRDLGAVAQAGKMHLCDGGGGDRLAVEPGEQVVRMRAQRADDLRNRQVGVERLGVGRGAPRIFLRLCP